MTWNLEGPSFPDVPEQEGDGAVCPGGLDFTAPNSAVAFRMISSGRGFSRFYYSRDRARTWEGSDQLPKFERKGIAVRTDTLVDSAHELTAFITASKENGREGRVLSRRTTDGGGTGSLVSFAMGPIPRSLLRLGWRNELWLGRHDWRKSLEWFGQMPRSLLRGSLLL